MKNFFIGITIGLFIFVYQVYGEAILFAVTGERAYSFTEETREFAIRKCAALKGISLAFDEDSKVATCYKYKQL